MSAEISAGLLAAIIMVESGGRPNPPRGAAGEVGPLQITTVLVDDLRRHGYTFTYQCRHDRDRSIEMFYAYMGIYATARRLGREPTPQDFARIWNGGPNGWRKPVTIRYWHKVVAELRK